MPEDITMNNMNNVVNPGPPPCGIQVLKGYKNGALSSELIKFVSSNPFTTAFYKWIFHGSHVEEHFMSTIGSLTIKKVENSNEKWKIWQQMGNGVKYQNFALINDSSW